jgi:putative transposase
VTPATLLTWHPGSPLGNMTPANSAGPTGPPTVASIAGLAIRLARENPLWGYRRIHGELTKLRATVAACTVYEILRAVGTGPAPRRDGLAWRQFLHAQAAGILAADLMHGDTVALTRLYVLVFIEHGIRRTHLGGVTAHPTGQWTVQQARNPLDLGDRSEERPVPDRDRGPAFTAPSDAVFQAATTIVRTAAVQTPRINAICERLTGTLRREFLHCILILNRAHLGAVLSEYQEHLYRFKTRRMVSDLVFQVSG